MINNTTFQSFQLYPQISKPKNYKFQNPQQTNFSKFEPLCSNLKTHFLKSAPSNSNLKKIRSSLKTVRNVKGNSPTRADNISPVKINQISRTGNMKRIRVSFFFWLCLNHNIFTFHYYFFFFFQFLKLGCCFHVDESSFGEN